MKNFILIILFCLLKTYSFAQFSVETIGNPLSDTISVSSYTGWANQGVLTFSGDAKVQMIDPSNNQGASGGGNVYFSDSSKTYFEISGFPIPFTQPDGISITFSVSNSQGTSLSDLIFEYTTDGVNYIRIQYDTVIQQNLWSFRRCFFNSNFLVQNLHLRFRKNSISDQFRVDDIDIGYFGLLSLKIEKFSFLLKEKNVDLFWTASIDNATEHFILEKSKDDKIFNTIGSVNSKGQGTHNYSFIDPSELSAPAYYRLKIKNRNGSFSYSDILYARPANAIKNVIENIFPLPAKDKLNIQVNSIKATEASIIVTDVSGKKYLTKTASLIEGTNHVSINVQSLPAGTYFLKINTPSKTETRKILVQH